MFNIDDERHGQGMMIGGGGGVDVVVGSAVKNFVQTI